MNTTEFPDGSTPVVTVAAGGKVDPSGICPRCDGRRYTMAGGRRGIVQACSVCHGSGRAPEDAPVMTTGLVFYDKSHRYKLDGEWVESVTGILGSAIPKHALPKWAAKSVAQYVATHRDAVGALYELGEYPMVAALKEQPWQERDLAAKRGTEVHDFAERIANGEEVDVPSELAGHVGSCIEFLDDWGIQPVLVEAVVGSRQHRYAGKLDLVADHNRGPRAIFDYKTSKSGIFAETSYQLVAYAFAEFHGENGDEHPMADLGIQTSYGVHIRTDGYSVMPLAYGPGIYAEFVHLLNSARIIKRAQGDWRTPGTGYVGLPIQARASA